MFYYLPICAFEEETVEHAILFCDHARAVWFGSNIGYLSHFDRNVSIVEWWKKLMDLKNMAYLKRETDLISFVFTRWAEGWKSQLIRMEWASLITNSQ